MEDRQLLLIATAIGGIAVVTIASSLIGASAVGVVVPLVILAAGLGWSASTPPEPHVSVTALDDMTGDDAPNSAPVLARATPTPPPDEAEQPAPAEGAVDYRANALAYRLPDTPSVTIRAQHCPRCGESKALTPVKVTVVCGRCANRFTPAQAVPTLVRSHVSGTDLPADSIGSSSNEVDHGL